MANGLTEADIRAMFDKMHGTDGGMKGLTPEDMTELNELQYDLSASLDADFAAQYPAQHALIFGHPQSDEDAVTKLEALQADGADLVGEIQRRLYLFSEKTALFVAVENDWPKTACWLLSFNQQHGDPDWPKRINAHGKTALGYSTRAAEIARDVLAIMGRGFNVTLHQSQKGQVQIKVQRPRHEMIHFILSYEQESVCIYGRGWRKMVRHVGADMNDLRANLQLLEKTLSWERDAIEALAVE